MNTQTLELDLSKDDLGGNVVRVGQGDMKGTTLQAHVYDGGAEAALAGYTAYLEVLLPNKRNYYRQSCTVSGNIATAVLDETKLCSVAGYTDEAYFTFEKDGVKYSTERFAIEILRCVTNGMQPAQNWDDAIDSLISRGDAAVSSANSAANAANSAASAANGAASSANAAAKSANDAAASAKSATNDANTAKNNADAATKKANDAATKADNSASAANAAKETVDRAMQSFTTIESEKTEWQVSDSGTDVPAGQWLSTVPACEQGKYLWSRMTVHHNKGADAVTYNVAYQGRDAVTQLGNLLIVKDPVDAGLNISWTGEE